MEPIVTGFHRHKDAASFLASMPGVYYLPDDLVYQVKEVPYLELLPDEIDTHGYNRRDHRLIASAIERKHTERQQGLIGDDDLIHPRVMREVDRLVQEANGPVLIFSNHATVALALAGTMRGAKQYSIGLVTGGMTTKAKADEIAAFRRRKFEVLIGTASLATGTDGLDKMCNTLIILDDTDDDSLRRQLIGRIMPRGADTDASMKRVFRFLPM
jgi:superfamily II DNA or RNA helicase